MKSYYFLMAASLALYGCNNDALPSCDDESDTPQEIRLGVRNVLSANVNSRSTGGVGNVTDPEDAQKWSGQTVYVFAVNNRADSTSTQAVEVNAEPATAPADATHGALTWTAGTPAYYNTTGVYSFYGMHIDDATSSTQSLKVPDEVTHAALAKDGFTLPIEINGSQDLMLATTDIDADCKGTKVDLEANANHRKFIYSAWSARRDVVPNLTFRHVMSRLFFQARAFKNLDEGKEIYIEKIQVKDAKYKCLLTVIPGTVTHTTQGLSIAEGDDNKANLALQERTAEGVLQELTPVAIAKTEPLQPIGESLLLFPTDEKGYTVEIHTRQDADGNGEISAVEKAIITMPVQIPAEGEGYKAFEAGKYYTINLTVYSMEEIKVSATLTGWQHGGDSDIDTDEPFK